MIFPYSSTGTQSLGAGQSRLSRAVLPNAITSVQAEVSTLGATTFIVVAYADTPNGPGALVAQSGVMDASSVGTKTAAMALPAGTYWIGLHNIGGAAFTMRSVAGANPFLPGVDAPGTNNLPNCWFVTGQGTSPPANWPTTGITRNGQSALIWGQAV